MQSNLVSRVLSALVLAPVVLAPIWFGKVVYEDYNIPLYPMLLALLGVGLSWEWGKMFQKKGSAAQLLMAFVAISVAFITEGNPLFCVWLILLGTVLVYGLTKHFRFALGVPYVCLPILSLGYIYYINENVSREIVLWLIFVVWATDIGGFVVGKTVGGPKLAPKISAKKTWSGLLGAILFAMAVAYVFALYLKAYHLLPAEDYLGKLVISAGVLAVISQVGDFFESAIKRKLNLKDSSDLIPGHGGLFDRVDGLLFAAVATAGVVAFFINNGWMN
ncbi:MAG: phosphatidate cytidylyltransferase [Pseudomonadota bacterium]|nr:phosphatidate cytidylyltransferase [Pseudomonadota bacterium]